MFRFVIIAVLALVNVTYGQIAVVGKCPNLATQKNFTLSQYMGTWYEIMKYDTIFQLLGTCATAKYAQLKNGSMQIENSMCLYGQNVFIKGNASEANPGAKDGKLKVSFPSVNSMNTDYWVLSTDYKNCSLVWSCNQITNNSNLQFAWVLCRNATITDKQKQMIENQIAYFGLDKTKMHPTNQTKCCNRSSATNVRLSLTLFAVVLLKQFL